MDWKPRSIPRFNFIGYRSTQVLDSYNLPTTTVPEEFTISNCGRPQPVTGNKQVPGDIGMGNETIYSLFTSTPLLTAKTSTGQQADRINIFGDMYTVVRVQPWQYGVQSHYKAFIVREE